MNPQVAQIYEFGPYRLDLFECKLWRESEEVKLRPKVFDLLVLLIEHRGQTIDKNRLIQRLWPNSIVEENNLTVTVNALRSALGEGQYIETVSKRGYRFIPEVRVVAAKQRVASRSPGSEHLWESPGGALSLHSRLYVCRAADSQFCDAMARRDSIVLVKGARQVGKTSLLARGLEEARRLGAVVIPLDLQQFNAGAFESADKLLLSMASVIASQMNLESRPHQSWDGFLGASSNFERFMRREVLEPNQSHVVWVLDEVDRIFNFNYANEVFGLFRSWHNMRALDPMAPWNRLTIAIAYATEAHLFITDLNQSPFNVGTRLTLDDFTLGQIIELNQRYGEALPQMAEVLRFHSLLGGHPYLSQRGLYEISAGKIDLETIERHCDRDEGVFGDHLKRLVVSLQQDPSLQRELSGFLHSASSLSDHSFYRLRSAGILVGDSPEEPRLRCELYKRYLKKHLS